MEQTQPQGAPTKLLLTMEEAAQALSLGRNSMYTLVLSHQVASIRVGARRLVPHKALVEFIERKLQAS